MSIDLKKLEHKLDEALSNETNETLTKFLTNKRMSNNKQSSIEWFLGELIKEGYIKRLPVTQFQQAKAMHKVEIVNAVDGFPIHTRHMDGEEYYEEIFEGEK